MTFGFLVGSYCSIMSRALKINKKEQHLCSIRKYRASFSPLVFLFLDANSELKFKMKITNFLI